LTALSEKSQHALQDLSDRVGKATLSQREWMEKVNIALDGGRYLEVRGAAGVGKSGRELLSELVASGESTLFIDGIDFFQESERATACNLVREAAEIPGFNVVVSARDTFGIDEPNWLPGDAIEKLGPTSVVIDELIENEIGELRQAASDLVPLLPPCPRCRPSQPLNAPKRDLASASRRASLGQHYGDIRTLPIDGAARGPFLGARVLLLLRTCK
jgi:hypothetical protein